MTNNNIISLNNEDRESLSNRILVDGNILKISPFNENTHNLVIPSIWMETQFPIRFSELKEKDIECLNNNDVSNLILEEKSSLKKSYSLKASWKQEYYHKYNKECKYLIIK